MDAGALAIQVLNALAYSMLLFLLAVGLSIIFGLMDFMNLAHGSFYMVAAYLAFTVVRQTGNFWLSLVVVPIVIAVLGFLLQSLLLWRVARRGHLDQVLLTFGLALIVANLVRTIWGSDVRSIPPPNVLAGVLWYGQQRTNVGAIIRAGVDDKQMVEGLGINIARVSALVFAGGVGLAALAGVITGPFLSVQPTMDFDTLIYSLVIVVIGGLGTLRGAFVGAILVGMVDALGRVYFPDFALMLIFALMAAVLITRPTGLFGRAAVA
jgi:branched-chain amino acid transport system permease protein